MKTLKKIFILFVLFFIYSYVISIDNIPTNITVFKGQNIKLNTLWGVNIKTENDSVETLSNIDETAFEEPGKQVLTVSLLDKIALKSITVSVIDEIDVIPIGEVAGIKLYTNGILVVGTSQIEDIDGNIQKPYEKTDIKEGDSITAINDCIVNSTEELLKIVNESEGRNIKIKYSRNNEQKECEIQPVKDKDNNYKLGLWVRDSAAGVGTITFYNEQTGSFAGLGHAITDIDTGEIINTSSGEIDDVSILSIVKGKREAPGKIQGTIKQNSIIGSIYKNTKYGIYGVIKNIINLEVDYTRKMKVASRQETKLGNAKILSDIDGSIKEYDIEIQKVYLNNYYDNKSMLIKVTDENLIKKTGGIIQGMSGSPIIQDGKFIGAVTHVFVNDPQIGYAVFGETMIQQLSEM